MNAAFDPVLPDRVVCGGWHASLVEPVASKRTELQLDACGPSPIALGALAAWGADVVPRTRGAAVYA
jgi:hypothetical protein